MLQGCIAGDRIAQAKLYQLYAARMLGVCMWYAKNREEAEEILHDGFMRVFTYLKTYRGRGSLEGWIRSIMVNAALFRYRNKSARLQPVLPMDLAPPHLADEASVLSGMAVKELVLLVQSLTPAYRLVFTLHVLEGWKHREIAEMLGISEGTSKSNLSAARIQLQQALARETAVSF